MRAFAGDVAARNALVEANVRLASFLAAQFRRRKVDHDDLLQEANLALVEAAELYNPADHPGMKFGSFAGTRIVWRLKTLCSKHERDPITGIDLSSAIDQRSMPLTPDEREAEKVWIALERIPQSQREPIVRHFGLDGTPALTLTEVGVRMGVTKGGAGARMRKCLDEMRYALRDIA